MKTLKPEVWAKAKKITMLFEGGEVTPNFDGAGLSMGIISWCLGQKTLQPILKKCFALHPHLVTDFHLEEFKKALDAGTEMDFAIRVINGGGTKLVSPWKENLTKLNYSIEFQTVSDDYVAYYKDSAINYCNKFKLYSDRAFALFFDICVQCGSIKATPKTTALKDIVEALLLQIGRFKDDVQKRKMAIVNGKDMGRGWDKTVIFNDQCAFTDGDITPPTPVTKVDTRKVTASELRIREAANTTSKILGSYTKDAIVTVLSESNGWAKTDKGYVSSEYLVKV